MFNLICTWERSIELCCLVGVLEPDVVADELGHLGQQGRILVVDHACAGSVHAAHFKSVRPELVCAKNISTKFIGSNSFKLSIDLAQKIIHPPCHVGHQQGNCDNINPIFLDSVRK